MTAAVDRPVALVTHARLFAGPPAVGALCAAGFQVVVHDEAFASAGAREAYGRAHAGVVVLAEQEPADIVRAANAWADRLDVLVSNDACPPIHEPVETADPQGLQDTLERLVVFPFRLAQAAIPHLRGRQKARVVFITSNRNRLPLGAGSIPDIARAGANALVRSLGIELAPLGIPVNAIAPNHLASETYYPRARFVDEPAGRAYIERTVPAGRLADPAEIGELIRYLATMEGSFLTGTVIDFSGGWPVGIPPPADPA
ncbi:SDR family oxidoreductase [Variovorax sp. J22P168]|uniref:SDR family oxidoreductase n=1 Tax=Variovorax jilinensis TaxID=3053513 RepID=UPI002575AF9D|nr:SDR family oxidoreductase [Variovorax sp. J22P168]MDM0015628.1 SDR family oxidoreductase [Variovorax sp. J22P168]